MTNITFAPGDGSQCALARTAPFIPDHPIHLHIDAKSFVRAYNGALEDCPHFREARVADALRKGIPT